jgi:FtsP/CotA-like multicopper oxidase with cupredoxin domain
MAASPSEWSGTDRAALEALLAERTPVPTGQTKRFELTAQATRWELVQGVTTDAVTFNGTVPGPTIRVTEGDTVEVVVHNQLDESTSIHWHGLHVPNDQDGVADVTQAPIGPGETFTYRFVAPHAGTFMYHAHGDRSREQIDKGLYAPFIIDPQGPDPIAADQEYILALQGWMVGSGGAEGTDSMEGMEGSESGASMSMAYDYFTINGRSYPATQVIDVEQGDLVRLRFINPSQTIHPMHLHGTDMAVFAKDGEPLAQPQRLNTLPIEQGETYDVAFVADNPGTWLLHCHDLHHASNAGVEPGGLITVIRVRDAGAPVPSDAPLPSEDAHTMGPDSSGMPGMPGM